MPVAYKVAATALRAAGGLAGFLWRMARRKQREARFMGYFEKRRLMSGSNAGFVLDGVGKRLSDQESFRNVAVVATTGAGKTAGFIVPNVLRLDGASLVVADPSGAIHAKTSGDLLSRGYDVRVLNPADPCRSDLYNPLERARSATELGEVAHILVKAGGGTGGDPFWTNGAEEIVTVLLRTLKNYPDPSCHNLANLHYLLNAFGDGSPLADFVARHADAQTRHVFNGFVSQSPNTMQGLLSTAKASLRMLADPDIAQLTSRQTFDFEDLRARKTALFLTFPQNRVTYYSFLMNLLYSQLFHFCLGGHAESERGYPIYFLLDEFGHATVPDFPAIVTTTRQRRVAIAIVLQSLSQLEERYGRAGAETVRNGGIATQLYYPGMDIGTAQMLERTMGTLRKEYRDSEGKLHVVNEPLLSAHGLRTLDDGNVLLLHSNKPPALLRLVPYFRQAELARRTSLPPADPGYFEEERIRYVDLGEGAG